MKQSVPRNSLHFLSFGHYATRNLIWLLAVGVLIMLTGCGVSANSPGTVVAAANTSASPNSLTWGNVSVGQTSAPKSVTLTNNSTVGIAIGSVGITGTNTGDYSISENTCGTTLAPSTTCSITLIFKPTATATRSATLAITNSGSASPQEISLSGTGTGSSLSTGQISVSPTSLSFGTVTSGAASSTQSITITNSTSGSVTLGTGAISGTNAGDFEIASSSCGTTLAAAASCAASITFSPATTGSFSATWSMTVSSSSTALSVPLSGTGGDAVSGSTTVNPTNLNFGNVAVGSASGMESVMLTNNASSPISVSSVTVSGADPADFAININACRTSSLHTACSVDLIFTPTATGVRTATLTFTDSASNSPQTVALTGTGTPASTATLTVSPSSLAFGSDNVGSQTSAQTFTLTAGGSGTVSFTSIGVTGTDPGDFSITANACGSSLPAGSSCTVSVAFKPTAIGNRVGLFSVIDNATTTNQTAEVSGTGAYSSAQIPAITVDFGSRSGTPVAIPSNILGTEYLESLPTNANRTTVVQGGFTSAR